MKKVIVWLMSLGVMLGLILGINQQMNSESEVNKLAKEHFGKALGLMKQTDYSAAIAEYQKVVDLLPNNDMALDAQYWIGQTYFQNG